MTTADWIAPGKKVAIYSTIRGGMNSVVIATVERLTATQIVCDKDRRFRRDTLRQVGDPYGGELLPLTDQRVRDAIARSSLRRLNKHIDWLVRHATDNRAGVDTVTATLDQIAEAVDEVRGKLVHLDPEAKADAEATS